MSPNRQWLRSMLFVPGQKLDWMLKAPKYGADALIFDLEDSVPDAGKAAARQTVAEAVASFKGADTEPALFVRVNGWTTGHLVEDVLAVVCSRLDGVLMPKTVGPEHVTAMDLLLTSTEMNRGLEVGRIELLPLAETATAVETFFDLCRSSRRIHRVYGINGLTPGFPGDLTRALGLESSESGDEMAYSSGRLLVGARAAGVDQILGGQTVDVGDLDLLRRSLTRARALGASGTMLIHPSHIATAHEVFSPGQQEVARAAGIVEVMTKAIKRGDAATLYEGVMVDYAHLKASLRLLRRAELFGLGVPEYTDYPALDLS